MTTNANQIYNSGYTTTINPSSGPIGSYTIGGGGSGYFSSIGASGNSYTYNYPSIVTDSLTLNGVDIAVTLSKIMERLSILDNPDPAKLEKYHALKKAYDSYKLLEKLFLEGDE
jgi:hypothetical protein